MKLANSLNRPKLELLPMNSDDTVERTGYRSPQQQIAELMNAGRRLISYRQEKYWGTGLSDPKGEPVARHYGELDRTIADRKIQQGKDVGERLTKEQSERRAEAAKTPPESGQVSMGTVSSSRNTVPAKPAPSTE